MRPTRFFLPAVLLSVCMFGHAADVVADPAPGSKESFNKTVKPFLTTHCYSCHDEKEARAGFRIDELSLDFLAAGTADEWLEVMNNINLGSMPPEDKPRPDAKESFAVVKWIGNQLQYAEKAAKLAGGQIPMRRLNRVEYANTVRDLFQIDPKLLAPIIEELPGDGKAEGFDRLGVALFFDQTQLERSLQAAETISDLVIVNEKPEIKLTRFEAEKQRTGGMGIRPPEKTTRNRFVTQGKVEVAAGPQPYEMTTDGVRWVHGGDTYRKNSPWGRLANVNVGELIPEDGYYRVRVRAGADAGTRGEPIQMGVSYNFKTPQELTTEVPITASIDQPDIFEVEMFLRRGPDDQSRKVTLMYNDLRKYIVSTPEFNQFFQDTIGTVGKVDKARRAGDTAEVERLTKFLADARQRAREWKGPSRHINPKHADDDPPKFYLDWMEFEGPLQKEWPPKSHKLVFFDGDERHDLAYAQEIFSRFLPRAYRRPVTKTEVGRVVSLIEDELNAGKSFHAAVRIGIQRILTSPGFLFIQEPTATQTTPRRLNDYELANRLSYFLWSTMPDEELFALAAADQLHDPKVLKTQVSRMLNDPKRKQFVENFGGQWLNVPEFGSVMPAMQYRDYDAELEEASKQEVYAFVGEILSKDLPVHTFLDSDFVMINERLARHYEIPGVEGEHFRRVALKPEYHRGGIFGMAGLMTLLSDGTRTLPVRRAAWVVTNLFNDPPPPPPPNAGEVQPNTEGERLTVRERLVLHRNEPTCASCHATLDPYGLALENYDAIGKWRTHQNGEGFRGKKTPVLDVSGVLPSGIKYNSLEEFKQGLFQEKDRFARAFCERLLTYALCRPVGYTDRETIDQLMQVLKKNDYRIQPLMHAVISSEPFLTK